MNIKLPRINKYIFLFSISCFLILGVSMGTYSYLAIPNVIDSPSRLEQVKMFGSMGSLLASIMVVLFIFQLTNILSHKRLHNRRKEQEIKHYDRQKRLLEDLKIELEGIKDDLEGHKINFKEIKNGLAFFPYKPLNWQFYLYELDDFPNDPEFKKQLSTIYDKVILLNNYLAYIMGDFNKELLAKININQTNLNEEKKIYTKLQDEAKKLPTRAIYHYWKNYSIMVMEDLEPVLKNVIKKIGERVSEYNKKISDLK